MGSDVHPPDAQPGPSQPSVPLGGEQSPAVRQELLRHLEAYAKAQIAKASPSVKGRKQGELRNLEGLLIVHMPQALSLPDPKPLDFLAEGCFVVVWSPQEVFPRAQLEICCPRCGQQASKLSGFTSVRCLNDLDRLNGIMSRQYVHGNCPGERVGPRGPALRAATAAERGGAGVADPWPCRLTHRFVLQRRTTAPAA